ncbi:MAG: Beta-ketoacyl synthase [Acidimicrobiales bacterium]|jgi:3-oxoacyl-[acyl-carrier-protein] synthase II|nr:Beta-ketoacyl synthase [Acidimicrobiales bacterium]
MRPIAITGIGVVSPCGIGIDAFWAGLCAEPEDRPERRVEDFDPEPWFAPKEARRTDRFAQFAMAAATMALDDAGSLSVDPDRAAVIIGTGIGGLATLQEQIGVMLEKGDRRVSPFTVPMMMANAGAANVSMRFGWRGPCETISTACAAGTHSVGAAARMIADGRADVALAGGAEAAITRIGVAAFGNMTALSSTGISRPFDAERDGFVIGEGSAVLVLESLDAARARGARIYAVITGAASNADAHHITAPAPGGAGAIACMELALADAGRRTDEVGHVNAHGTSTPLNDAAEAEAIAKVFGAGGVPVTSIKGVTGHGLGAAGALEAAALALTIDRKLIPPTARHRTPDPAVDIDVVTGSPRPWEPRAALSNSFGFGGHNGCLLLEPVPAS